ncbi:MAG: lysophospholipid acyltransferase family protein [Candidatus Binataceae bacterium]
MARQIGRLRAWAECATIVPLWAPLRALPLERAVRFGAAVGTLGAALDRFNRGVAARNLEIAFPEADAHARRAVLRAAYRNFGRMAAEWVHFRELNRTNIERYVTYEGREHWNEAIRISNGRGILVLTGHFGNFELLSQAHSIYGNPTAIVYRPLRNPILDGAVAELRRRFGNATVPRKGAGREIMRFLRDNWMVAVPLDLDVRHGVFVDFFSLKAATSPALARVAMVTGAPVLPAFMVREGASARHRITFLPVIDVVKTRDRVESVRENTQRFSDTIELMVRRYPDHWNWIHRRWKTRPPGEARFY